MIKINLAKLLRMNDERPREMKLNTAGLDASSFVFDADVPSSLLDSLQSVYDARNAAADCMNDAYALHEERINGRFKEITGYIGHRVIKKSKKPFKGGADFVKVQGIIAHPYVDNAFAFVYHYSCDDGGLGQSYIRCNMVKPYFADVD
jgi:hypothetical protein